MFTPLVVGQDQALKDANIIKPQETIIKKTKQMAHSKKICTKEFVPKKGNRKKYKFS